MFSTNCDSEKQMGAFQKPLQCQWSHIVAKKLNKHGNNHKFSLCLIRQHIFGISVISKCSYNLMIEI